MGKQLFRITLSKTTFISGGISDSGSWDDEGVKIPFIQAKTRSHSFIYDKKNVECRSSSLIIGPLILTFFRDLRWQ